MFFILFSYLIFFFNEKNNGIGDKGKVKIWYEGERRDEYDYEMTSVDVEAAVRSTK